MSFMGGLLVMGEALQSGCGDLGVLLVTARVECAQRERVPLAESAVVGQLVGCHVEAVPGGERRRAGGVAIVRQAVRAQTARRPDAGLNKLRWGRRLVLELEPGGGELAATRLAERT